MHLRARLQRAAHSEAPRRADVSTPPFRSLKCYARHTLRREGSRLCNQDGRVRERLDYGLFFAAKVVQDLKAKTRLNRTRAVLLAVETRRVAFSRARADTVAHATFCRKM